MIANNIAGSTASPNLRRSRSLRRSLRADEPGMMKTTLRASSPQHARENSQQIRKTRSMVAWTSFSPTPERAMVDERGSQVLSPTEILVERSRLQRGGGASRERDGLKPNEQGHHERSNYDHHQDSSHRSRRDHFDSSHHHSLRSGQATPTDQDRIWQRKLRSRASFIITPFRKKDGTKGSETPTRLLSPHEREAQRLSPSDRDTRKISQSSSKRSETLKDKLKRYFRKTSASSSASGPMGGGVNGGLPISNSVTVGSNISIPPQHIEARRIHFGHGVTADERVRLERGQAAPSSSPPAYDEFGRVEYATVVTEQTSTRQQKTFSPTGVSETGTVKTRSRVTSWADSSLLSDDDPALEPDDHPLSIIAEDETLQPQSDEDEGDITALPPVPPEKRNSSISSSFLRKFPFIPRRGASNSSTTLAAPAISVTHEHSSTSSRNVLTASRPFSGALSPSDGKGSGRDNQQKTRRGSLLSIASWRGKMTVRSVTPDCTPVTEEYSPNPSAPNSEQRRLLAEKKLPDVPDSQTQPQFVQPSPEQRNQRALKAENRWQNTLDESRSLFFPRSPSLSPGKASLSMRTPRRGTVGNDFSPRTALSPSVYSRATDESSGTPRGRVSGTGNVGMATILASGEPVVATVYPLQGSPKKKDPDETVDWHTWLESSEPGVDVSGISIGAIDRSFLTIEGSGSLLTSTPIRRGHQRELQCIGEDENITRKDFSTAASATVAGREKVKPIVSGLSPTVSARAIPVRKASRNQENRPPTRQSTSDAGDVNTSSVMNDRFPMFDTGGPSSRPASNASLHSIMSGKPQTVVKPLLTPRTSSAKPLKSSPLSTSSANLLKVPSNKHHQIAINYPARSSSSVQLTTSAPTPPLLTVPESPLPNRPSPTPLRGSLRPSTSPLPSSGTPANVILSPIPRRRQSTLVATLTSASLATSYHTAQQETRIEGLDGLPVTPKMGTPRAAKSSPALIFAGRDNIRGLPSSQSRDKDSASSTPSTGIRRSGARRGTRGTWATSREERERPKGIIVPSGASLTSLGSDFTLLDILRNPMYRDGVFRGESVSNTSRESLVVPGAYPSSAAKSSAGNMGKENTSPARPQVSRSATSGGESISPGKRLAERWLNERKGIGGQGVEHESPPVFL